MSKYWSASTLSFYDSNVCTTSQMPSDKVQITDTVYNDLMARQAEGYRIVHNSSTGEPEAISQNLTAATATTHEVTKATGSVSGHVTLSDSTSSTSGASAGVAATPKAVKAVADAKAPNDHSSTATTYGVGNGTKYGHLKLSDSTSSTSAVSGGVAATPKAVKDVNDAAVHKTGEETIAGKKTFSDSPKVERVNPYLDLVQTDITKGTAPSATSYAGVRFGGSGGADSDANRMGAVHHNYYSNGANIMRLEVTKPEAGSTETASVAVAFGADGVAYATAPTPANADDNSTKIATTEWVQDRLDEDLKGYLPLSGGTMTGGIVFDGTGVGKIWGDGKDLCLGRGTDGSILRLRGHDTEDNAGGFHIRAMDAEGNYWYLIGYANGKLTWGSYDIINAYGGTMEGKLNFLDDGAIWSDGQDLLIGDIDGSLLRLRNLENPELPGVFQIRASNGDDQNVYLVGHPDGTLTWNGKSVLTTANIARSVTDGGTNPVSGEAVFEKLKSYLPLAGGTMTGTINFKNNTEQKIFVDSGGDLLLGDSDVGGLLRVRGNNSDSNPGGFQFRAQDASASQYLIGKPDGTLTWGGKNIVRTVNGVSADAAGNVALGKGVYITETWSSGTSWYRKWSDGWCEQGGYHDKGDNTITTASVTFPTAFSKVPLSCNVTRRDDEGYVYDIYIIGTPSKTGMSFTSGTGSGFRYAYWHAYGY